METTHVATTPNRKPPTVLESISNKMGEKFLAEITNFYSGNSDEAKRFKSSAIEYIRRNPKLMTCDVTSLLMSLVQIAQFKFMPSSVSGEAYIIPYNIKGVMTANFQLGYQGIKELLYRSPRILAIESNIIYENDLFEHTEGLNPILIHKPVFGKPKGKAIGVYTVAQLKGGARTFNVMDEAQVMAIKALSKAKNSPESPWNGSLDPERWMWRKTCLIQHAKMLPKTAELIKAIEADYEGEGFEKSPLDVAGVATAKTYHTPDQAPKEVKNEQVDDVKIVEDETPGYEDESMMEGIVDANK